MNGILNIYKEAGYTSHDVVAKLRGILHMKKIGHTGTLDPDAEGVLPVCIGKATGLCSMITDWDKTYETIMLLGMTTDTQDISGNVLSEKKVELDEKKIIETVQSFVGDYNQIPPMYSALKHNGKKLYELARSGIEIERQPRHVNISSIRINNIDLTTEEKTVTMTVTCSKGTYIRTLCDDIGKKLGCGACMKKLARTRVGRFTLDNTLTLNQVQALVLKGAIGDSIISVDEMFDYDSVVVEHEWNKLLYNGNSLPIDVLKGDRPDAGTMFSIFDETGDFVGIYRFDGEFLKIVKMFYDGPGLLTRGETE